MAEPLKVEYISIDNITPYAGNAKLHPQEQIEQIKQSIQQFGFNDPLALWHGEVVEGHGRLIAAKELGMKEVPVIRLDELTDEQRRAYALVHNKLTMNSGFDFGTLEEELANLEIDMGDFGFDIADEDSDVYYGETSEPRYGYEPPTYDDGFREAQEPLSAEELKAYSDNEDDYLTKRRVIITYLPEQEDALKNLLGISDEKVRVVYDIKELME